MAEVRARYLGRQDDEEERAIQQAARDRLANGIQQPAPLGVTQPQQTLPPEPSIRTGHTVATTPTQQGGGYFSAPFSRLRGNIPDRVGRVTSAYDNGTVSDAVGMGFRELGGASQDFVKDTFLPKSTAEAGKGLARGTMNAVGTMVSGQTRSERTRPPDPTETSETSLVTPEGVTNITGPQKSIFRNAAEQEATPGMRFSNPKQQQLVDQLGLDEVLRSERPGQKNTLMLNDDGTYFIQEGLSGSGTAPALRKPVSPFGPEFGIYGKFGSLSPEEASKMAADMNAANEAYNQQLMGGYRDRVSQWQAEQGIAPMQRAQARFYNAQADTEPLRAYAAAQGGGFKPQVSTLQNVTNEGIREDIAVTYQDEQGNFRRVTPTAAPAQGQYSQAFMDGMTPEQAATFNGLSDEDKQRIYKKWFDAQGGR